MLEHLQSVPSRVPQALSLPPKWLGMYEEFVTKNASSVGQIESALRSLSYIIPGRFRESELASESLHSFVQLLSIYHDSLLSRALSKLPASLRPHPSPHNRYTRFWSMKSTLYHRVALTLQTIQYTELLWEMVARRRGEKARWRVVVFLEFIKAICRLLLLRLTNSRPLVSPPLPERAADPRSIEEEAEKKVQWDGMSTEDEGKLPEDRPVSPESSISTASADMSWTMPRTGLSLPSLPDPNDISTYLLTRVLKPDDIKPPKTLLHRVSGQGQIAELLYILRPVLYALAMQRFSAWQGEKGKRDWRPWLLGFGIEYGSRQLAKKDLRERVAGGLRGLTGLEREELKKRGWNMGWWVMRGAFYENITKSWIHSITGKLKNKPLLDLVSGVVEDYEYLWNEYYFSTATM